MTLRQGFQVLVVAVKNFCFVSLLVLSSACLEARPALTQTATAASGFDAKVTEAVRTLADDPRFKGLTEQQRRDRIEFVAGNVLFALVHEVGHMLIAEMGLPVLGREEDAADAFATLTGLKLGDAFSDRVLIASARGWFLSDRRNQKENIKTVSTTSTG